MLRGEYRATASLVRRARGRRGEWAATDPDRSPASCHELRRRSQYADFKKAVCDKLFYEIWGTTPIPLPAPVFLLLVGLFGMGVFARRKKTA